MKLSKLIDPEFQNTLKKLAAQEIPLRTAFTLRGIIKSVNDELNKYDEVRTAALNQFGDKDADGKLILGEKNAVQINEENMKQFVAELNALLQTEVNVGSIKLSDLGDKASLTTSELITLDDLVTE